MLFRKKLPPICPPIFGGHLHQEYVTFSTRYRYLRQQIGDVEQYSLCCIRFKYVHNSKWSRSCSEEGMLRGGGASTSSITETLGGRSKLMRRTNVVSILGS